MGLFWKKKKVTVDGDALFRDITQDVVTNMMSMRIIKTPELKFFFDDKGILEGLIQEHTTQEEVLDLKKQSDFTYMFVCGMHAFGAGAYVTIYQTKAQKPVSDFGQQELRKIALSFSMTDSYELALSAMGLDANSNNKKVFDKIIMDAIKLVMNSAGNNATSPDAIRQLMKVLYNAGITVVMR